MKRVLFWTQIIFLSLFIAFAFLKATEVVYPVKYGRKANPSEIHRQVRENNLSLFEARFYRRLK